MGKKKNLCILEKATKLIEGGVVEINGHYVRAVEVENYIPCNDCIMDSVCNIDMCDLCGECEAISNKMYILQLTINK